MKGLKSIFKFMKGNKHIYVLSIVSIILATFFTILGPLLIRLTIDSIIGNETINKEILLKLVDFLGGKEYLKSNIWIIGLILIGLTALRGLFLYLKNTLSSKASENTAKTIREEMYDHIQRLPYEYHVNADTGDLIQRCSSDVETIRRFLAVQLVEIGGSIFTLAFISYVMFNLNVKLALVSMAAVPIIFIFAFVFFSKIQKVFLETDEAEAELSTVLQENLTGIRVVKAFARQNFEIAKFSEKNEKFKYYICKITRLMAWYWSISDLICMLQIGAVVIVGSMWAANGELSLGTLVVFITYEGMLLWPVRQMGRILTDMGKSIVSVNRIEEILNEPIEIAEENFQKPNIDGNVSFEDVYFEYEKGKPVLKGVSFDVKKGETIAILGPTGSGKSSLVHLLPRLYEYNMGSIKIDGIELKNIDKKWVRKNIGLVLQEPFLFAKTVKDNIKIANSKLEDRKVYEAAKIASIHEDIVSFDKGYDTPVGERGVSLSGGQKQRIAIARTIINECPIIVFDDSLSAVDTETDIAIREALNKRKNKSTTFIISHRISTVMEADEIIVIDKGKIVQKGTHESLIKQDGLYKRVYNIQNSIDQNVEKVNIRG
ncbi:ABC transporter ATP-binding protein [Anaerosalibacter sp. Marseille-P3206]|uniref:ABC transporter ATP-binding protein n=1 Tax=Anaerosalibacter sp. Marseille-P3206 TaxID=1871005 RepID=UPI00098588AA|nr:ABC transporter ATP-binding protein [Anaerosalibacter sp. Marseille-P3206]